MRGGGCNMVSGSIFEFVGSRCWVLDMLQGRREGTDQGMTQRSGIGFSRNAFASDVGRGCCRERILGTCTMAALSGRTRSIKTILSLQSLHA